MGDTRLISISIPAEMYNWLEENKKINRSQLFREAVLRVKGDVQEQQNVPSLMFLVSIMGIVFSIALIGIAITPTPVHVITRAILALLGGFLAFTTSLLYYRERKKVKRGD